MEKDYSQCNFLVPVVSDASIAYNPMSMRIKKAFWNTHDSIYTRLKKLSFPKTSSFSENDNLNLQPGEWVQVRSLNEIYLTLDERQKYKGLYFMPEMEKFCGKKFKIVKRAQTIKLEPTGEVRKLKSPSIFLEGVCCTGEGRNMGCERHCFHFWKEAWLKRISDT
jgi:hypothetical protein